MHCQKSAIMRLPLLLFLSLLPALWAAPKVAAADANCDRECLRGFMTKYLDALRAHSPGLLPTSGELKVTEDSEAIKLGQALVAWEEFKVYGGQIHAVEAFMRYMPSSKGSGWE